MQFNSFVFILLFLPLTVVLYFIANSVNNKLGKFIILFASIIFYGYTDYKVLFILSLSLCINYLSTIFIVRSRDNRSTPLVVLPIIVNIIILLYFKYFNFAISNVNLLFSKNIALNKVVLPLGISFFTFQQISYIVAISREDIKGNNLLDYIIYIMYFPKILMGPLMDPVDFIEQLNDNDLKKIDIENIALGIKIFSLGLFKKVMFADVFAKVVNWGYSNIGDASSMDLILVILFYSFEIYFDFSGYSDMATGASLMLNIKLPINFDSPYKALSIKDFWKRWHISLTSFLTKYIYIPLGGNKRGIARTYINIMFVFIISGIWHGANWTFILWGVLNGALSIIDKILDKYEKKMFEAVRWIGTFIIVTILWSLFRAESIKQWSEIMMKILMFQDLNITNGPIWLLAFPEMIFFNDLLKLRWFVDNVKGFWVLLWTLLSFAICLLFENNYRKLRVNSFAVTIFVALIFIWSIICLSSESSFVYFNF